jgi:hypothetical protein
VSLRAGRRHFEKYGKNHKLNVALIIGGVSFDDRDAKLLRGRRCFDRPPGRLLDHFERGGSFYPAVSFSSSMKQTACWTWAFIPDIERSANWYHSRGRLFSLRRPCRQRSAHRDYFLHNPVRSK